MALDCDSFSLEYATVHMDLLSVKSKVIQECYDTEQQKLPRNLLWLMLVGRLCPEDIISHMKQIICSPITVNCYDNDFLKFLFPVF